jgi:GT2 family glycosyltransferase
MKKIAVLLTVFNRKEKTLTCLHNLLLRVLPKVFVLDVFLVNDGCTDGTPEEIKQRFPSVNIINSNGNLFWNRGMHLAWQTAAKTKEYDFYLWLNDDTILNENALETLLQTSLQKENQSIIVGATSALDSNVEVTYGGRSHKTGLISPTNKPMVCDYFNGNIVLIPNFVYKKVGTNDPVFHHALGDFDYGLRAAKLGIKSYIAPSFLGRCDVHETLLTWCNPNKSFKQRWKAFRSPLGNNPEEFFVFQKRHKGFIKAIMNYFTNHLRVVFPSLWKKK